MKRNGLLNLGVAALLATLSVGVARADMLDLTLEPTPDILLAGTHTYDYDFASVVPHK